MLLVYCNLVLQLNGKRLLIFFFAFCFLNTVRFFEDTVAKVNKMLLLS